MENLNDFSSEVNTITQNKNRHQDKYADRFEN